MLDFQSKFRYNSHANEIDGYGLFSLGAKKVEAMVTTSSTQAEQQKKLLLDVVQVIKPYLQHMDRPWPITVGTPKVRRVNLGFVKDRGNVLMDREGNFYWERLERDQIKHDKVEIDFLIGKFGFEQLFKWVASILNERYGDLRARAESISEARQQIAALVASYVSSEALGEIGDYVCVTEISFHWERTNVGTPFAMRVLQANFYTWCPRHRDGRCDGKRYFKNIEVAFATELGPKICAVRQDQFHPQGSLSYCPGEDCGLGYVVPVRGRKEIAALTIDYLVSQGYSYVLSER